MNKAGKPNQKSALVIALDGFSPRFLGCQGNTWIDTPGLNRMAAESQLFENAIVDSTDAVSNLQSLCLGTHAIFRRAHRDEAGWGPTIQQCLSERGVACSLLTDASPAALPSFLSQGFANIVSVGEQSSTEQSGFAQTHCATSFAQLLGALAHETAPFFFLVYLSSLARIWDAPYQMRARHADPDEPDPPNISVPPRRLLTEEDVDPDELTGLAQCYAAQIELADLCIAGLLEELHASGMLDSMLLAITGVGGFPLGEHRAIGHHASLMHAEAVHVPLLVRVGIDDVYPSRIQHPVYPASLYPTLVRWFSSEDTARSQFRHLFDTTPRAPVRQSACLCIAGDDRQSIWTENWMMIDDPIAPRLFAKPDDRWEVNDVADRCPQVVAQLKSALRKLGESLAGRDSMDLDAEVVLPERF